MLKNFLTILAAIVVALGIIGGIGYYVATSYINMQIAAVQTVVHGGEEILNTGAEKSTRIFESIGNGIEIVDEKIEESNTFKRIFGEDTNGNQ